MNPLLRPVTVLCLAGALSGQGGLGHEVGWLPEPHGALVATEFADMNGDGFLDIVRLRHKAIEVLLQNPVTGRYVRASSLSLGLTSPLELRDLAIGRLDPSANLLPDVAVLWSNGDVDVLDNNGATLTRIVPRPVPALPNAAGVAIWAADVSGDLVDDLIVILEATPPQYVQQGPGLGAFTNVTAANVPAAIAYPRPRTVLADTDGDGDLDLVVASSNPLPPTLLRNQGGAFVVQNGAFGPVGIATGSVMAIQLTGTPLPELVFGNAGTALGMPTVLTNAGGSFNSVAVTQSLRLRGVLDMARVDVDRDGADDVVFLESTGRLGFALRGNNGQLLGQPMGVSTFTEPFPLLSPYPGRVCLADGDVESDGDVDVVAGGDCPDSLLIHGPGAEFHDTERFAFPITRRAADYAAALVDRDLNGDVDFVGLHENGEWLVLDNDGSGYFTVPGAAGAVLPPLPPQTLWRELSPMSVSSPGRNDLLAFGDNSGGAASQIAVLVNQVGSWIDRTTTWFGGPVTGPFVTAAAVYPGGPGGDHLLLATSGGELELHMNNGAQLVHQAGAFPAGIGLFAASQLIVADFDDDGMPDVLALSTGNVPPRLFFASAGGFVAQPAAVPLSASGDRGIAANIDADGDLDVLLRTTGQAGVSALRWNHLANTFSAVTLGAIGAINFEVRDIAVVRVDGTPRILLARDDGPDALLAWNGAGYGGPVPISYRGTPVTRGLLTADVERDGDLDILALRGGLDPAVIINETVHLQPLGPVQSGRTGQVLLGAPAPGSLSFVSYGLPLNTPTPWGLLRLDPATMGSIFLGTPAGRQVTWTLPLGAGLPWIRFPIQAAWITPGNEIVLSGLEHLTILPQ